jgi:class 3 adenylate cyclase
LGGPQLPFQVDLCIEERAIAARFDLTVGQPPPTGRAIVLRVASQALGLFNDTPLEIVLRVERLAPRPDALTASRAASMALFRKLFPGEVLSQGQLASVSVQTFLATRIDDGSPPLAPDPEEAWFAAFQAHLARADEAARRHGGAMVKSVEAGALAVFPSPDLALRAALDLLHVRGETAPVHHLIRCGIHSGPARIATLNDRLEYLGASVRIVQALAAAGEPGEIALSERAAIDPQVADRIGEAGWSIAVGSGGTENARLPPFIRVLPS